MKPPREPFTRRRFLAASGAALAVAAALRSTEANPAAGVSPAKRTLKKGIMWGTLGDLKGTVLEKMRAIKAAGFDGAEMMSHMDVDEVLRARDATGLVIPSVCGALHWAKPLSDPNPAVRATGLAGLRQALHDARRYGATSVLLVPAVVKADVPYDVAYARSQEEIRKAIPLAEELGVKIALENVRNYFLLTPLEAARYVDEFGTPAVGWHFDVGNSLHYGWPEHWIHILGPRIQQLHFKELSRKNLAEKGVAAAFAVEFLEGDNNWPAVMKAVDEIGYHGWAIAEPAWKPPGVDPTARLHQVAEKMDQILAL